MLRLSQPSHSMSFLLNFTYSSVELSEISIPYAWSIQTLEKFTSTFPHTLQREKGRHISEPYLRHVEGNAWNISGDVGLVSAGRINKGTPPLTTPSHTSKSSAMDISSYIF